jgi:Cell wall-active antibiotics response LiaF, C-terminal/DUF1707 SHOCT-like domain
MSSLVALRERRERVIERLSECYERDLLDVDELDRLLDQAHGATTVDELDSLVAGFGEPATALAPHAPHAIADPSRLSTKTLRVMFSHVERTGHWVVPRTLHTHSLFGNIVLDFRDASLAAGTTTLDIRSTFGTVELILPPWLAIDVEVSSIAGTVEERHRIAREPDPTEPLLQVSGIVRFGNLCISTRLPGETRDEARKREKRERRTLRALPPARGQM